MFKQILISALLFFGVATAQTWDTDYYWLGGAGSPLYSGGNFVFAGDYDGSTEYLSKTSPVNLDLNDTDRVALDIDNDLII